MNVWAGKQRLLIMANRVICIAGAGIFLFLVWYSMRYTQYIEPGWEEKPLNVQDSVTKSLVILLGAAALTAGLLFLEKRFDERLQRLCSRGILVCTALWIGLAGLWWITATDRVPVGDQAFIYGGASYFMEGQYSFLQKSGYCSIYPHQLGLIALVELLFCFTGALNYFAFQVICVLMSVGIVLLGYLLVRQITSHRAVAVLYCLLMCICLPLVFYTGWVYGEIPSIFFILLTALSLLRYAKGQRTGWLVLMVCAVVLAVLVRKNSLIMVIALCLTAGIYALLEKDKRLLAALVLAAVLPGMAYSGIYRMYELRSGYEHQEGLPAYSHISMGLQESQGKYGWYTTYGTLVFSENNFDAAAASVVYKSDIKARLREFMESPGYTWEFFREKLLSQWNEPLYESIFFSVQYAEGHEPAADSAVSRLISGHFTDLLTICDKLQLVVYFGMLCYFLFAVRGRSNILQHMTAVTIIGGFLFSIIWEAKARYAFPYYVMMFPLAAIGYRQLLVQVQRLMHRRADVKRAGEEEELLEKTA